MTKFFLMAIPIQIFFFKLTALFILPNEYGYANLCAFEKWKTGSFVMRTS